jgi:transcriptional regulator with XRE-family HTH domain
MKDIKSVTADNICSLRSAQGMTQAELAGILNYSDKAISKWERGESLPDVSVLKQIAEVFGVPSIISPPSMAAMSFP